MGDGSGRGFSGVPGRPESVAGGEGDWARQEAVIGRFGGFRGFGAFGGWGWRGESEAGRAFDAEGVAEGAEDATEGGVGFEQGGHCRVGQEVFEFGAGEGGAADGAGDGFAEPGETCGETVIRRGFGGLGGGRAPVRATCGARWTAGEDAGEAVGEPGDALPDHEHQSAGEAEFAALDDDGVAQEAHDRVEAIDRRILGCGWVPDHQGEISTMGGG